MAVVGMADVEAVTTGDYHTCAMKSDGTAWCWGWNAAGNLGNGTTEDSSVPVQVSGVTDAEEIGAGNLFSCCRLGDGTAWCWGFNYEGALGDGTTEDRHTPVPVIGLDDVVQLSVGGMGHSACALVGDGTAWCWGDNVFSQLGDGTTTNSATPVQVLSP